MRFWEVIVDAVTPGSPRHRALQESLARDTERMRRLSTERHAGVQLEPLDEIATCAEEITAWH